MKAKTQKQEEPKKDNALSISAPKSGEDAPLFGLEKMGVSIRTNSGMVVLDFQKALKKHSWSASDCDDLAALLKIAAKHARRK